MSPSVIGDRRPVACLHLGFYHGPLCIVIVRKGDIFLKTVSTVRNVFFLSGG